MTDILTRLAALTPEHPAVAKLREYIRRGFGFVAYGGGERRWTLSDEEVSAINIGVGVLADSRRDLIALVQEAAGEIERLRASKNIAVKRLTDAATAKRVFNPQNYAATTLDEMHAAELDAARDRAHESINPQGRAP